MRQYVVVGGKDGSLYSNLVVTCTDIIVNFITVVITDSNAIVSLVNSDGAVYHLITCSGLWTGTVRSPFNGRRGHCCRLELHG